MKARRKGTNEPFMEIELVTFAGSTYVDDLYNVTVKDIEFEQQQEPTSDHWQDVRERAAIAAMQGILANSRLIDGGIEKVAQNAIKCADALVDRLKGE